MGVTPYVLSSKKQKLSIGDGQHVVGTLEMFASKMTEMSHEASATFKNLSERLGAPRTPSAVILPDESILSFSPDVTGRMVLGWDAGRVKTQDYDFDHLPVLGYAASDSEGNLSLHEWDPEEKSLTKMTSIRATELGILDSEGKLAKQSQPTITQCLDIERVFDEVYRARCVFDNGIEDEILIESLSGCPDPEFLTGKRPDDVKVYDQATGPTP